VPAGVAVPAEHATGAVVRPPVLHARVWVGGVLTAAPRTAAARRCPSAARSSSSPGGRSCDGVVEVVLRQTDPDAVSARRWGKELLCSSSTRRWGKELPRRRWALDEQRRGVLTGSQRRDDAAAGGSTSSTAGARSSMGGRRSSPAASALAGRRRSATATGWRRELRLGREEEECHGDVLEDGGGGRMRRRRMELPPSPASLLPSIGARLLGQQHVVGPTQDGVGSASRRI
jgi:hypothetical protein